MIQRKQSLFLFGAAIMMLLTLVLPFAKMDGFSISATHNIGLMAVAIVGAALNIFTVFKYNDRKAQSKLSLLSALLPVIFYGIAHVVANPDNVIAVSFDKMAYGFPLAGIALILSFLAKKSIDADEKLVKSVDRLR